LKPPGDWCSEASIWQLVESCGYSADLEAWHDLTRNSRTGVLDLGCGIGRVAHHLARSGIPVTGIDRDEGIVADFNRRSPEPGTRALAGDAADPELPGGHFDRIIAPQQLLQILGDRHHREALITATASRLTAGGVAAFAFSEGLPAESVEPVLMPDLREVEAWIYSSRPVRLEAGPDSVTVDRLRQRVSPDGELVEARDRTTLARLTREELADELIAAGLGPSGWIEVPATDLHVASVIAIAGRDG
jgi:SAM-dependent methyltransferase